MSSKRSSKATIGQRSISLHLHRHEPPRNRHKTKTMPSLTDLIATSVLLTPTLAFDGISSSLPSPKRTFYLPPYGTVRSSIVVCARNYDRDDYNYRDEWKEGGNYWTNPAGGLDRYPSAARETSYNGFRKDEVTVSGGRAGGPRREPADWWETKRLPEDDYDEYYEDEEEYGLPPPSRSRSSFRTGAPPPPRPIRDFYNKLFWFGFDPSTTRSTDRTMFGGTRGKFNAIALLRDREMRQQNKRSLRGKRSYDPAIQDFGDVREWNERKMGTSPAGGKGVGDDAVVEQMEEMNDLRARGLPIGEEGVPIMDAEFDPVMEEPYYDDRELWEDDLPPPSMERRRSSRRDMYYDDEDEDDFDFELERRPRRTEKSRRRSRSSDRRRGWDLFSLPDSKRAQAEAYDRFIGLGPRPGDEDDDDYDRPRARRRDGYAYKYNREYDDDDEDDFDYDMDDDVIDVRPKRSSSRRRSWEERAMEMDRIPPRSVAAWGPNGRADKDAQTMAAIEAEREIEKAKKYLDKKEDMVDDAKQDVISLKADAAFYEKEFDQGRDTKGSRRELGYILRDVEDASRILRMAKAERDAAAKKLDRLKSKHWALLSEYDAVRSFELD